MSLVSIFPNNLKSYPTGTYCRMDEREFAIHKQHEGQVQGVASVSFDGEIYITEIHLKDGSVKAHVSEMHLYPVISED